MGVSEGVEYVGVVYVGGVWVWVRVWSMWVGMNVGVDSVVRVSAMGLGGGLLGKGLRFSA